MKPIMFYDIETMGLPLFDQPSEDPRQPHIVQLSAMVVDPVKRQTLSMFDHLVRPDGWTIPEEVVKIHGITTERALAEGISEREVIDLLLARWRGCEFRVGHGESFDARIVRIALKRYIGDAIADEWREAPAMCTAKMARSIMKGSKPPKLTDAYEFFVGRPYESPHSAHADATACKAVYFAIQDRGRPHG